MACSLPWVQPGQSPLFLPLFLYGFHERSFSARNPQLSSLNLHSQTLGSCHSCWLEMSRKPLPFPSLRLVSILLSSWLPSSSLPPQWPHDSLSPRKPLKRLIFLCGAWEDARASHRREGVLYGAVCPALPLTNDEESGKPPP